MHATSEVGIPADGALLRGDLTVPESAIGVVAFAHGSVVIELNQASLAALRSEAVLEVIPGAGHLFEEPGALERVELLARTWFVRWLGEASGR